MTGRGTYTLGSPPWYFLLDMRYQTELYIFRRYYKPVEVYMKCATLADAVKILEDMGIEFDTIYVNVFHKNRRFHTSRVR
jgi:hypothetical protein